ncbi:hypothetical protein LUZ61_011779 [Rhynchospora tenuis]|uniref:F-box domain-containing protein n=1 Tax=Rhynchospora tenuis TaxID=198213 RepID=A0AAD6A1W3_9POAL|nr:hypothetical protein LUZ61_011779 [Rhynchospora tenuis]
MDWSELLPDLLHLISKRLPDLSDFIRFRAVCKRWRSAAPTTDPPPQLPWYVETTYDNTVRFKSLSTGKSVNITFFEVEWDAYHPGSSNGHILVSGSNASNLSLLNPLTRNEIPLPLPPTDSIYHCLIYTGLDPVRSGDDVVLWWFSSEVVLTVGICRPGDQEWETIQLSGWANGQTYYKGMYYVIEKDNPATKIMDIRTGATLSIIPPPICASTGKPFPLEYLIVSSEGLLGVSGYNGTHDIRDFKFEVYRLDDKNKVARWIKINSIGDRILFLDNTKGFCLSTNEIEGFKGDCIYFITDMYEYDNIYNVRCPICRYDLKNRTAEKAVSNSFRNMSHWFFPRTLDQWE